jgi:nucleoside-diphosphate-sugar epimerase
VVKALLDRSVEVVAYDMDPRLARLGMIAPAGLAARVRVETGRIEDTARVKSLVREGGITHIVHLAAVLMPFCQKAPVAGAMVNVIGTLNVFEAARDAGRPVRVVYASSAAVWGPEELYGGGALSESAPLHPATHYGVFKHANEDNARVFFETGRLSSVGLRPWTVYGVGRDAGLTAGPTLAMKALVLRRPFRIGLTGPMDLQYVEDVAAAFVECLLAPVEGAHVFNLAGDVIRVEEFVAALERLRPAGAGLVTAEGPHVPVAYRMDDAALRARVPGIPKTPLVDGMEKTLRLFEGLKADGRLV